MAAVAKGNDAAATNGKRWHDLHPELGREPVPIEPYISQAYFELERERIFRKVWLNIGRVEELPKPGDYLVKDLPVCKTSLLVVRGKDDRIRAFHNVCSHRSNKLVWNQRGSCQNFACKFHGWSYNLEGQLTFVPDEESFFDIHKKELGLTPVATDTWEGFIFINLEPQPRESLQEYLGELGETLQGYPFAEYSATCFSWTTELRANWKILKDAFQEAYHVAFLHKRSVPDSFTSKSNPFCHGLDYKLYPRHRKMAVYGNMEHRPTPVESMAFRFGALIIRNDFSLSNLPPGVNPTRDPSWSLDLNVIFPNFFVDVSEGSYFTYNMWPLAVDRTLWEVRNYFPKAKNAGQRFSQEYSKVIFRDVIMEDASTLEQTQTVLASGAKPHFILQDQEILIRHDQKVHEDFVGFYKERNRPQ
ncbi:MAG TPA: SRPBCC family protein [Methylomirabilota bacterium]|jgi:phenylpropionate dioxygenase-like ring-hydroxylating dioxygenase large terminal subunit|nr:SRPBCC family protein [Methylomirabilota bacterium]